jgi:hypothetical protein
MMMMAMIKIIMAMLMMVILMLIMTIMMIMIVIIMTMIDAADDDGVVTCGGADQCMRLAYK